MTHILISVVKGLEILNDNLNNTKLHNTISEHISCNIIGSNDKKILNIVYI